MSFIKKHWHQFTAGLLGLLIFLAIFGLEPLRYTGIGWTQHGYGGSDITQHQIGWMFYRNSPWTFPLCKALFLGYPEGSSISYTDSIPLAALFFKVLSPLLPEDFQYFGLYTCFSFMMQGIFAGAILYLLTKNRAYSIIGSSILITAGTFLERCFRHTALSSHWLLLAALLIYLSRKKYPQKRLYKSICLLMCVSLGIHPYLFAMVFILLMLSEAELLITDPGSRKRSLNFLLCTAITIAFGFVTGLFGTKVAPANGFGMYSLNLNALFNPKSAHHALWSMFLPQRDIFPPQGDGIYYLGLPLLCITACAVIFWLIIDIRSFLLTVKRYIWLLVLMFAFTVFAVSNVVTFDSKILFVIPLPGKLTDLLNIFRSSARFFFLPYYGIIIFSLSAMYKILKSRKTIAALCCLLISALQIIEIRPGLEDLHKFFETRYDYIGLSEDWSRIALQYNTARTFDCLTNQSLAFWLAKNNFRTDMMITAAVHMDAYWQRTEPERNRLKEALSAGTEALDPDTIYIISSETGTNRSFSNDAELESYIETVRNAYQGRADLLFLTDWVRDYWVLCPIK
ncbi:MAG: hypothetical protein IJI14_09605 [Anaerolineaceae bacterium]|nr:hypothetical protein [Anaerolineaceae bacterium]